MVGFVTDGASGRTPGFEVLFEGDGQAFEEWLEPYAKEFGVEILVSDDNDSYSVAAAAVLGLDHQLCIAHHVLRKYVAKRSKKSILERAKKEDREADPEQLASLERDLARVRQLVEDLRELGEAELGRTHRRYSWAQPPKAKRRGRARASE